MADPNELVYVQFSDTHVKAYVGRSAVDRWPEDFVPADEPAPVVEPEPAPAEPEPATPSDPSTSAANLSR